MGKTKSSFRGKTRKNADLRKRSNSFSYLKLPDGVEVFTPEVDSKVNMDIMPYLVTDKKHPDKDVESEIAVPGSYWYKRPFKTHRSIGAQPRSYVCPSSFGKKCYICEYREKLSKEEGDEEELKALKTSDRNLYAVIIKDKKNKKGKIYVLDTSDYLFQEEFEDQLSDDEKFEIFPDHKEGYTLRVRFVESSFGGNKFAEPSRFDFIERETQYSDSILEQIPNLDECLEVLSYEDLKDKFLENLNEPVDDEDEDEDNEDEDDEKPVKKGKTPVKKSKPKPEDDEDEDDDDDDDEDEDDDEDDDDDDDEKPVSRKRKSAVVEKPKAKSTKELTCPSKHKFGKDTDKFDDCDDCKIWNECYTTKKGK